MSALLYQLAEEFQIPLSTLFDRQRTPYPEERGLVPAEVDASGREHLLTRAAADAWQRMQQTAARDGISMYIVSAFRSIERQRQIVRRKLQSGVPIAQVMAVSALPGYSEHHTGRAVDVGTPDSPPLEHAFKDTAAFRWLHDHAATFEFRLSYPLDNQEGYVYEPWHWCYRRE